MQLGKIWLADAFCDREFPGFCNTFHSIFHAIFLSVRNESVDVPTTKVSLLFSLIFHSNFPFQQFLTVHFVPLRKTYQKCF